jgi:MFS transporter, PHS family, inorganic phosphate transporter
VVVVAFKSSIIADSFENPNHVDYCWRVFIGLGCIPGAFTLYFRLAIPETPKFTMGINRDVQRARADIDNVLNEGTNLGVYWVDPDAVVQRVQLRRRGRRDFIPYFGQRRNLLLLVGVAYSWFAIDASCVRDQAWLWNISFVLYRLRSTASLSTRRKFYPHLS